MKLLKQIHLQHWIRLESSTKCRCCRNRIALPDPASRHTAVTALNHHRHIVRICHQLHDLRDITANPLLKLETFSNHICNPRDFTQAKNISPWNIGDADFHVIHQRKMMFAIAENLNIFHKHHILRILCTVLSKIFPEHIGNLLIGIVQAINPPLKTDHKFALKAFGLKPDHSQP